MLHPTKSFMDITQDSKANLSRKYKYQKHHKQRLKVLKAKDQAQGNDFNKPRLNKLSKAISVDDLHPDSRSAIQLCFQLKTYHLQQPTGRRHPNLLDHFQLPKPSILQPIIPSPYQKNSTSTIYSILNHSNHTSLTTIKGFQTARTPSLDLSQSLKTKTDAK